MMARRLRAALGGEALLLLAIGMIGIGEPIPTPAVLLATCGAFGICNACLVVATYAVFRRYAATFPPGAAGAGPRPWRCTIGELLALFATFVLIQPFERWWMGPEEVARPSPGHIPVLLVHGYLCNRGLWWWLRRRLRARQCSVATISLEPPLAGLDELAARLRERIDALLAQTGAPKLLLVTHSMGALVCRAYLQQCGAAGVAALVTLAAPHHGTRIARLGWGRNARQMQPDSQWLRRLNAGPLPSIPTASIWTTDDEILVPPETGRLAGAREVILEGLGHMAMVFSPRVLACLEYELAHC